MDPNGNDDSDSISITSTVESEPQEEYVVDCILAEERRDDGNTWYLAKWAGYPDERSTWEPSQNFTQQTIDEWLEASQKSFFFGDPRAEEVKEKVARYEAEKEERRRRRRRKIARLGSTISAAVSPEVEIVEESPRKRQKSAHNQDSRHNRNIVTTPISTAGPTESNSISAEPLPQTGASPSRNPAPTRSVSSAIAPSAKSLSKSIPPVSSRPGADAIHKTTSVEKGTPAIAQLPDNNAVPSKSSLDLRTLPGKAAGNSSKSQVKTSSIQPTPLDTAFGHTDWVKDYQVGSSGAIRPKPMKASVSKSTTNDQSNAGTRGERAPSKIALNLKPADQWTGVAKMFTPGYSSNTEASRGMARSEITRHGGNEPSVAAGEGNLSPHSPSSPSKKEDGRSLDSILPKPADNKQSERPTVSRYASEANDRLDVRPKRMSVNGRSWERGEALVHLHVCGDLVGATRFRGFGEKAWLLKTIIHMKAPGQHELHLDFSTVFSWQQFTDIYRGRSVKTHEIGWVQAYEDTQSSVSAVARAMAHEGKIAVLNLPSSHLSFFLCSSSSREYESLRQHIRLRELTAELVVIVTAYLPLPETPCGEPPPRSLLAQPADLAQKVPEGTVTDSDNNPTFTPIVSDPRQRPRPRQDCLPTQRSPTDDDRDAIETVSEAKAPPQIEAKVTGTPTQSPSVQSPPSTEASPRAENDQGIMSKSGEEYRRYFKERYGITTHDIMLAGPKFNPEQCFVFLYFDKGQQKELARWKKFLSAHNITTNQIYDATATGPPGQQWKLWKSMMTGMKGASGTIIVQEDKLRELPNLSELAEKVLFPKKTINVFTSNLMVNKRGQQLRLLFPFGGAILLTEITMRQYPELSLSVIRHFRDMARAKRPGSWKLFLRPGICVWLRSAALASNDSSTANLFLDMLLEITHMLPAECAPFSVEMPAELHDAQKEGLDGGWTASGEPIDIVSPAFLDRYGVPSNRSDVPREVEDVMTLVEYFAAWALRNAFSFRKFYIVTPQSFKRWESWSHVKAMKPKDFCREFGINGSGNPWNALPRETGKGLRNPVPSAALAESQANKVIAPVVTNIEKEKRQPFSMNTPMSE